MSTPAQKEPAAAPTGAARPARSGLASLIIAALVVLNTALAGSLLMQLAPSNTAEAQARRQQPAQPGLPRPSDYLMIPARPVGMNQDVIFILDTATGDLTTMGHDQQTGRIDFLPPLRLSALFERAAR